MLLSTTAYADVTNQLNVEESDGSPSTFPYKLKVGNGSLTDNGDGTATLSGGGTPGTPISSVQTNQASSFAGDQAFVWDKDNNTLSISKDSGQTGYALRISDDAGIVVANISHDGTTMVKGLQVGTTNTDSIQIAGAKGINITADTSGIRFIGTGGSFNEDLRLDLNTTTNRASISSTTGATSYFTTPVAFNNTVTFSANQPTINDGVNLVIGQGSDSEFQWNTAETNDTLKLGLVLNTVNDSGNFALVEFADIATNFGYTTVSDPTLVLQGSDATQTSERGRMWYDSTNNRFIVSSDNGSLLLSGISQGVSFDGVLTGTSSTNAGWGMVSASNQACNTTCNYACAFGFDQGTLGAALPNVTDCADATADECICMGPN